MTRAACALEIACDSRKQKLHRQNWPLQLLHAVFSFSENFTVTFYTAGFVEASNVINVPKCNKGPKCNNFRP